MQAAARIIGIPIRVVSAGNERDFDAAFATTAEGAGALMVAAFSYFNVYADRLVALAASCQCPSIATISAQQASHRVDVGSMEGAELLTGVLDRRFSGDPVGSMEFIDLRWLLDHHEAKVHYRREMVEALGLRPGDTVLDVGCGPGLWSEFIAEKVWPSGRVVGLDLSTKLIRHARCRQKESPYGDIMEFHVSDFYELPFTNDSFSATFFGNCFSYVTHPERVLSEQKRVVCSGGRIAVKDFDGGLILFHPVDHQLSYRVLGATAQALKERPPNPPFDNYMGRKLHVFMKQSGLLSVATKSYAIQLVPPLSSAAKRYIAGNAQWYGETAKPFLLQGDIDAWFECFDPNSDRCILDRDDFYFCMVEVLCIGTVE